MGSPLRTAQAIALGVPALLLAGALISEYAFGLFPCEMCWWQRYGHIAALGLALVALVVPPKRALLALSALAILAAGLIGGFHAGVEYDWWEGVTACTGDLGDGTGDPLEAILNAPLVRCDVAPWTLAGISLAGFNFLISTATALLLFILLGRKGRA